MSAGLNINYTLGSASGIISKYPPRASHSAGIFHYTRLPAGIMNLNPLTSGLKFIYILRGGFIDYNFLQETATAGYYFQQEIITL